MTLEARFIHQSLDQALLRQTMDQVFYPTWPEYNPANPDNETTESVEGLMEMVKNPPEGYKPFIMVVGENLDDPEQRNTIGFLYGTYFPSSATALQIYIAVKEEYRRNGIGRSMMDFSQQGLSDMAKADGQDIKAIVFEIHDPKKVFKDNAMDPRERKRMFERWGAREVGAAQGVDLGYTQPYWEPGGPQEDNFMLMADPIDGNNPDPEAIEGFLCDLYGRYAGMSDEEIGSNLAYAKMMAQLDLMRARMPKVRVAQDSEDSGLKTFNL